MSPRKLKVLFVAAEVAPFATVGGLSQVMKFLPEALVKHGLDVRIIMPKFALIDEKRYKLSMEYKGLAVPTGSGKEARRLICNVKKTQIERNQPTVYFIENMEYYEKRSNVYGYSDDHVRFALLSRATIEFLLKSKWIPDIIHANDWHTAYLINDLRTRYRENVRLHPIATLLTIHNLYQGVFDFRQASEIDLDDGKGSLPDFFSDDLRKKNALKRGIIYADAVNTVSENYAAQITTEEFGEGLHNLFREIRVKLFGILNGIDQTALNPEKDTLLASTFSARSPGRRAANKLDIQKIFRLEKDEDTPLLGFVGRLKEQKGIPLLRSVLPRLLTDDKVHFVIVGTGDRSFHKFFAELEKTFPGRVGTHLMSDFTIPRKIFAGADIILIPSRWEPGGIVAMEAMRYGAVPVVHETGGLADIVEDYNPHERKGTGFTFPAYDATSLLLAVTRALETYRRPDEWKDLVIRCLRKDFSWEHVASEYMKLYEKTRALHTQTIRKQNA